MRPFRLPVLAAFLLISFGGFGQKLKRKTVQFPRSVQRIRQVRARGWDTLSVTRGDLNRDGLPDWVFAFLGPGDVQEEGVWGPQAPAHPKVIAIYLTDSAGRHYLACLARNFPGNDQGGRQGRSEDPSISISPKGVLQIYIDGPAWHPWYLTYKFRYQGGAFRLIGFEQEAWESIGTVYTEDFNLLTGRAICMHRIDAREKYTAIGGENGLVDQHWEERRKVATLPSLERMAFASMPEFTTIRKSKVSVTPQGAEP